MQIVNIPISKDQREETRHGTYEFPFVVYENIMSKNFNNTINWHWHEELQLCYVQKGDVSIFMSGKKLPLREGSGAIIGSGFLHMIRPEQDPHSIYVGINLHPKLLRIFSGSCFEKKYVSPFLKDPRYSSCLFLPDIPWQNDILTSIKKLYDLDRNKPYAYEYSILSEIFHIWKAFTKNYIPNEDNQNLHTMVKGDTTAHEIMAYIQEHYTEDITIKKISEAVSFSPSECCRIFKRVTRDTIFSYLKFYRITKSTELLKHTEMSISDIAYECGFSSTSYYIDTFKKHTGMTPLKFRKL